MNKEQKELIKKLKLVKCKIQDYPICEYNKEGKLICTTYANGTKDKYEYNKEGKLICTTYADGTKYEYNKEGNLICTTYANGNTDKYKYNKEGKPICTTYANGKKCIDGVYYEPNR